MKPKTLTALKASIEHWKQNVAAFSARVIRSMRSLLPAREKRKV